MSANDGPTVGDQHIPVRSEYDDEGFAEYVARCPGCGYEFADPIAREARLQARGCCNV